MAYDLNGELSGAAVPSVSSPVVAGQIIGERYLIGEIIGEGGMGVVCAATHVGLGTPVAIKLIRSDMKRDPQAVERFLNEARIAASLKGEHIARVFDVGQLETGEPYLVMEQLEGIGLDAFIQERGHLSQAEAVDIVLQACEGLAEAHAVSLVHRDIKPANLFLARRPDGQFALKILDFGISKRLVDSTTRGLTNPGVSLGSPWYMSPEQMLAASQVDQRADIWSLGVLLFELLTKEYPFSGDSVPQVCASVLTAPPPLASDRRPDLDPGLDRVLLRCLEKEPDQRYPSVAALSEELRPFASRAVQSSALALEETQPFNSVRQPSSSANTFGSLALSRAGLPRSRRSSWPAALGLLAVGALLAGFGWPYAREHGLAELLRTPLPWDPRLGADPLEAQALLKRGAEGPRLLQITTVAAAPRNDAPRAASPVGDTSPAAGLTPEEVQQRSERYESWLKEQGLIRLQKAADDARARTVEPEPAEEAYPPAEP